MIAVLLHHLNTLPHKNDNLGLLWSSFEFYPSLIVLDSTGFRLIEKATKFC